MAGFSQQQSASKRQAEIKRLVHERGIRYLLHFTQECNLETILSDGLYPRTRVDNLPYPVAVNDQLRLDKRPDSVSLSLGHPNSKMFYKYRVQNPDTSWVVLAIHPSVLWENPCAFSPRNAAKTEISQLPLDRLAAVEAFDEMFEEIEEIDSREKQALRPCDPTDVQAEVLVFDTIPPHMVRVVVFEESMQSRIIRSVKPGIKAVFHPVGRGVFACRNSPLRGF